MKQNRFINIKPHDNAPLKLLSELAKLYYNRNSSENCDTLPSLSNSMKA